MRKLAKLFYSAIAISTLVSGLVLPFGVRAAETPAVSTLVSPWYVTNLAHDAGDWRIESYKVDRDLVAWTELNDIGQTRRLYAYDGVKTTLLAEISVSDWNDPADFFDPVKGNYDAADGLVVWTATDGSDREIWSFDGAAVRQVSNNTYDDKHPVTAGGRIAWTSVPGPAYNLMIKDRAGLRRLDSYMVLNYAFSGPALYWLNMRSGENWFRVFRNEGQTTQAIGQGDDRAIQKYFYTDGKGSAAWEYSTKRWDYDKRIVYAYVAGGQASPIIQRDVPPNITRLEDVDSGTVLVNSTDLLTNLIDKVSLIKTSGYYTEKTILRRQVPVKARFMDDGFVRLVSADGNSTLVHRANSDTDGEQIVSPEYVLHDAFDADGNAAAGAIVGKNVLAYAAGKATIIPTAAQVRDIDVGSGQIAWIEGVSGQSVLKTASQTVLVRTAAGVRRLSGHLVKADSGRSVYLAATDGKRYLFATESQFYGWYQSFASVRSVPASSLASMPLGGNVLYRPGYRLVRAASSPRIYSVSEQGVLHWIVSPYVLADIFGKNWPSRVDIVPDTQLTDYTYGQPVIDAAFYSMALSR